MASRIALGLAALLSALVGAAHVFLGGPVVVAGLFGAADLPENVAALAYFTWHCGTVSLLVMAIAFLLAARQRQARPAAIVATMIACGFAAIALGIAISVSSALWSTPAPYAFAVIGAAGLFGIMADRRAPGPG